MKKIVIIIILSLGLVVAPTQKSHAIVWWIVKNVAKKVINAIDIRIQKLQNKTIGLQNAAKIVENKMSKLKLDEIESWAKKEKELFKKYYDELAKVKNAISTYQRVRTIIREQIDLVEEYKRAYNLLKNDPHFTPQELSHIYTIYSGLIEESLRNLNELYLVVNSMQTKMTDGKRLELIASVADKMEHIKVTLRKFNRSNEQISIGRARSKQEMESIKRYYGMAP